MSSALIPSPSGGGIRALSPELIAKDPEHRLVSSDGLQKWCSGCAQWKLLANFNGCKRHWTGYKVLCKKCQSDYNAEYRKSKGPTYRRNLEFVRKYGITVEQYEILFEKQNGSCAICDYEPVDDKFNELFVDHDHKTGEVRGLLCRGCNTGLGNFEDKIDNLIAAIAYLRKE